MAGGRVVRGGTLETKVLSQRSPGSALTSPMCCMEQEGKGSNLLQEESGPGDPRCFMAAQGNSGYAKDSSRVLTVCCGHLMADSRMCPEGLAQKGGGHGRNGHTAKDDPR